MADIDAIVARNRAARALAEAAGQLPDPGAALVAVSGNVGATAKNAYHMAFHMLGGVPALAVWGGENKTEFYRQYSKMVDRSIEVRDMRGIEDIIDMIDSDTPALTDQSLASEANELGVDAEFEEA